MPELDRVLWAYSTDKILVTKRQDFGRPGSAGLFPFLDFSLCLTIGLGVKPRGKADRNSQECSELCPEDGGKLWPSV